MPYPTDWAPPASSPPGCAYVSGVYDNWTTHKVATLARLFTTAGRGHWDKLYSVRDGQRVHIDANNAGTLEVTLYGVDGATLVLHFYEHLGMFRCHDGRLTRARSVREGR